MSPIFILPENTLGGECALRAQRGQNAPVPRPARKRLSVGEARQNPGHETRADRWRLHHQLMLGTVENLQRAAGPGGHAPFDRLGTHDLLARAQPTICGHVGRGAARQRRNLVQRRAQPAQAWRAKPQLWMQVHLFLHPGISVSIGRQIIIVERVFPQAEFDPCAGDGHAIAPCQPRRPRQSGHAQPHEPARAQPPHGRAERHGPRRQPIHQRPQRNAAAHGVCQDHARAVGRKQHLQSFRPGRNIALKITEIADITQQGIAMQPVRQPLAAPVDDRHRMPRGHQIADHAAIFLDHLGPAREQHDQRPVAAPPMRHAQPHAVVRPDPPRLPARWRVGDGTEQRCGLSAHPSASTQR